MGGSTSANNYGLNINMIGESMYLLNLYLSRNIYTKIQSKDKKEKKTIRDFWNFNYLYNSTIDSQIESVFKIYNQNKKNIEINSKEVLIVHAKNQSSILIDIIFARVEEIKIPHYMPLIIFLLDDNDKKLEEKIIPKPELFPHINPSLVFTSEFVLDKEYIFESAQKELTEQGEKKMEQILNILLRCCSYHNDLGDRFSIGEGNYIINYDLTEIYFPFTINICCIGRFGKGKSTCVNCILGETKAKESNSGATGTNKINYYQITDQPIKVYDIPGFENNETVKNAIDKLKQLNDEINELKDHLHIILYVLKSTDERMFADAEYGMIHEISKQKNSKLLYVLTHSSKKTEKDEIIDRINVGLKNVLEKNNKDDYYFTFIKMKANEDNCVFVNFRADENNPVFGISDLFYKITEIAKQTETYKKYIKKEMTELQLQTLINEEADIRKKKAEKILLYHSIGAGVIGIIPGLDLAIQKFVIQKSATKKIGQIFGLDINLISKEDSFNTKNAICENNFNIEEDKPKEKEKEKDKDSNEKYCKAGQFSSTGVSLGTSIASKIFSGVSKAASQIGSTALRGISISFLFIGSAIGIGTGFYFTYDHCKQLIEKLYKYYKENTKNLSDSFIKAILYLELRAKKNEQK